MSELPPGLILLLGAAILPFLRGGTWKAASVLFPAANLGAVVWLLFFARASSEASDGTAAHAASTHGAGHGGGHGVSAVHAAFTPAFEWAGIALDPFTIHPATTVFALIFSFMACFGAIYALNQDRELEMPAAMLYAGSAINVTFAGDMLTMFIWWELMAVGSTLVVWAGGTDGARKAGFRYVNVHLVGGAALMAGIGAQWASSGTMALPHFTEINSVAAALILVGVLINAAAPPFGGWLADAYPEASESGTVFLSAFTTKTSVFVLMQLFAGTELLIWVGLSMAIYGIIWAILENDMRRILAYSIVNQVGFMVCAIGIGTPLALNGAAAHAFAHIIYKALLLMSAGSVYYMTGKRKCTQIGGFYRTMPVTMICGTIGAFAISSFPGTSGFTTKSMITAAAAHDHITIAWFGLMAASAGVFLHAGIKFPWFVFFQKDSGLRPPDPPANMQWSMIVFAALCVLLGFFPQPLYQILPFASHDGEVYNANTVDHVITQLQLLLFSGLAFFLMLPLLERKPKITLDFDWAYRSAAPGIWSAMLLPLVRLLTIPHRYVTEKLPSDAAALVVGDREQMPAFAQRATQPISVGAAVVITLVALAGATALFVL